MNIRKDLHFSSIARAINVTNVTFMRLPKSYGLVRDNIEPYEVFSTKNHMGIFKFRIYSNSNK